MFLTCSEGDDRIVRYCYFGRVEDTSRVGGSEQALAGIKHGEKGVRFSWEDRGQAALVYM